MRSATSFLIICLLLSSCSTVKKFNPDKFLDENSKSQYEKYFNHDEIARLKYEWPTLYNYLKKGHLQKSKSYNDEFILSQDFYSFIRGNLEKVDSLPWLNNIENFQQVFGIVEVLEIQHLNKVVYQWNVLDSENQTMQRWVQEFFFDESGKLLIRSSSD